MARVPNLLRFRAVIVFAYLLALAGCTNATEARREAFDEATTALRQGQLVVAAGIAEQHARDADDDEAWRWRFRLLQAEIALARLDGTAADDLLAADIPPGAALNDVRTRRLYVQARAAVDRGQLQRGLELLSEAAETPHNDKALDLDTEILGGQIRLRLGQWAEAERRLQIVVKETAQAGDPYRQALALINLGMGQVVRVRCDAALAWFEQALELTDIESTSAYALALNNAGICHTRLGEFDRAVTLQRRAVAQHERTDRVRELQQALGELGSTYSLMNEFDLAVSYLDRALAIATKAGLNADAAVWARNLANTYLGRERWDEAAKYNVLAQSLNPPDRPDKRAYDLLHEGYIAAGRQKLDAAADLFGQALTTAASDPAIQWSGHDALARLALTRRQPERARENFEKALRVIETTRSDLLKTEYKLSFLTRLIGFYQVYVGALVDEGEVERALEVADSSRGRVLAERQNVAAPALRTSIAGLQRLARQSGAVLLSYWLTPNRSHLWLVSADQVRHVMLPPAKDIEVLVREHQRSIESSTADVIATAGTAGDRLYAILLEPIARWVPTGSKVVIAPDGALHRLNFETLPVRTASNTRDHFLVEDLEIQVAPALSLLSAPGKPTEAERRVLLIGNPRPREPEFPALAYAPAEMDAIARHFPGDRVTAFRSDGASPMAYADAGAERYAMIHFTAHATANTDSPLDSAVILSGPDNAYKLYARDIAAASSRSPLSAELVTISACRSAGERAYSGEGLIGFAWAFLRAGSRRVVAGLWDVDDRSTATLMDRFYEGIAAGEPPARALRNAKLALMKTSASYSKPYYWAAFQMFTVTP